MEDKRTELQKKFEEQTPTIKGVGRVKYLQTFVSWLHLQVERLQGEKLPIHNVSQQRELLLAYHRYLTEELSLDLHELWVDKHLKANNCG